MARILVVSVFDGCQWDRRRGRRCRGRPGRSPGAVYGVKFTPGKLALGLATPGQRALHHVAPGSGAGGVGIEHSEPASHFVVFGGLLDREPGETMDRLVRTLDLRNQPEIKVYGVEEKRHVHLSTSSARAIAVRISAMLHTDTREDHE